MSHEVWRKLWPGAHIEKMISDFKANAKYCSKEGQLIEHGSRPRQGERTDINELKVQLDAGRKPLEIARARCSEFQRYRKKSISHGDCIRSRMAKRPKTPGRLRQLSAQAPRG